MTKIVHGDPVVTTPDSVMYSYDALSRVTMVRRNTLAYPAPTGITLDTLTFAYDSVTLTSGAWCSRLLWSKDALKVPTTIVYGTATGAAKCLPVQDRGAWRGHDGLHLWWADNSGNPLGHPSDSGAGRERPPLQRGL